MITNPTKSQFSAALESWPALQTRMALHLEELYGLPSSICHDVLRWDNSLPFKRTLVHRHTILHNVPNPHQDFLEQVIDYHVPLKFYSELAAFDGSLYPDRTAGEMTAKCHLVEANFMAINLANDIIEGRKTAEQARDAATHIMELFVLTGKKSPYITGLLFKPKMGTADPGSAGFYV
jgi:hypothetical protein